MDFLIKLTGKKVVIPLVLFILIATIYSSCSKRDDKNEIKVDNEYTIQKLFTHEGCSVYRYRGYHSGFFTNCSEVQWSERHGKRTVEVNNPTQQKQEDIQQVIDEEQLKIEAYQDNKEEN